MEGRHLPSRSCQTPIAVRKTDSRPEIPGLIGFVARWQSVGRSFTHPGDHAPGTTIPAAVAKRLQGPARGGPDSARTESNRGGSGVDLISVRRKCTVEITRMGDWGVIPGLFSLPYSLWM